METWTSQQKVEVSSTCNLRQLYTLLSCATMGSRMQLLDFDEEKHIAVNEQAKVAMAEMRKNKLFSLDHSVKEMHGRNVCLFNIRS